MIVICIFMQIRHVGSFFVIMEDSAVSGSGTDQRVKQREAVV